MGKLEFMAKMLPFAPVFAFTGSTIATLASVSLKSESASRSATDGFVYVAFAGDAWESETIQDTLREKLKLSVFNSFHGMGKK